ncbi:MAG: hypothetical protein IT348_10385 [Candidatus Eisenbacteria bacterium]|nr:hypothetical protein [Candidatus Eisenbacteria bacterium]
MTTYYEPTEPEWFEAAQQFSAAVDSNERDFKVGRCAAVDFTESALFSRPMYQDADDAQPIFTGSKGKAAVIEETFIEHAIQRYQDRCLNEKIGGGPQSGEPDHVVYVVRW